MYFKKTFSLFALPKPGSLFLLLLFFVFFCVAPFFSIVSEFFVHVMPASLKAKNNLESVRKDKEVDILEMSHEEFEMLTTRTFLENSGRKTLKEEDGGVQKSALQDVMARASETLKSLEEKLENFSVEQEKVSQERVQNIIKMFEKMKPKVAAPILDKLDAQTLLFIVQRMKGGKLSEILSALSPQDAAKITETLVSLNQPVS